MKIYNTEKEFLMYAHSLDEVIAYFPDLQQKIEVRSLGENESERKIISERKLHLISENTEIEGCIFTEDISKMTNDDISEGINSLKLKKKRTEAEKYLSDTGWYIERLVERGIAVPEEVTRLRLEAIEVLDK